MKELHYNWTLKDAIFTKDKGKVFSCFACGGGSTMGYKLAGFDVIGCNEIDPKMMACYIANHNPKYSFLEPIQTFKDRVDLPDELYNLDILDGSPPCSSFSMAGNREKDWGKDKKFREGQQKQILDTLFFDFIDLAKKLQPKVVIAENVKGLLMGGARKYYRKVHTELSGAGYHVMAFLLNASKMGVPQRRERVFVVGVRKDLGIDAHKISMNFNYPEIQYKDIRKNTGNTEAYRLGSQTRKYWRLTTPGNAMSENHPKKSYFNEIKLHPNEVIPTIRTKNFPYDYLEERVLFLEEALEACTFPKDYNFLEQMPKYLLGMSVPPLMTARIGEQIYLQVLKPNP